MKIKKMEHVFFQVLTLYINFLYKAYEFLYEGSSRENLDCRK